MTTAHGVSSSLVLGSKISSHITSGDFIFHHRGQKYKSRYRAHAYLKVFSLWSYCLNFKPSLTHFESSVPFYYIVGMQCYSEPRLYIGWRLQYWIENFALSTKLRKHDWLGWSEPSYSQTSERQTCAQSSGYCWQGMCSVCRTLPRSVARLDK